jgi:hypothetical protein
LCVIDAVFFGWVRYDPGVENIVIRPENARRSSRLFAAIRDGISDVRDQVKLKAAQTGVMRTIPGQRSGISFKYFLMLTGEENYVKPDRHVRRFLNDALCLDWRPLVSEERAEEREAALRLESDFRGLTPARLDSAIWNYQRFQKKHHPVFSLASSYLNRPLVGRYSGRSRSTLE